MEKLYKFILQFIVLAGFSATAQLKTGNNPTVINPNSALEIESVNKGLLLPRLALTSTATPTPLNAHIEGMVVYNTATTGDVLPGFYYNDGNRWLKSSDVLNTTSLLAQKEDAANKSTTTTLGTSNVLFPTQNAVKTYVDTAIAGATIVDADATTKGKLQLAGDLAGTAAAPTVPGLALKENTANKSTDIVADAASTTKYPSVKVIKDYVDTLNAAAVVADGSITSAKIADATIVNADVAANAQIDFSKLNIQKSNILGLGIVKGDLGLGNVDNTSDADKPVSTATQSALDLKAPLASPTFTGTVSGITKAMVGLNNVDNTSDADKPVSTAIQTALALKAPLESPAFTGTPTLPTGTIGVTQTAGDSSTALATTAFVTTANATNANLTGPITSVGNATTIMNGAVNSAQLASNAVTTDKILNSNVTIEKISASGIADATTFLRGDGTWTATVLKGTINTTGSVSSYIIANAKIVPDSIVTVSYQNTVNEIISYAITKIEAGSFTLQFAANPASGGKINYIIVP